MTKRAKFVYFQINWPGKSLQRLSFERGRLEPIRSIIHRTDCITYLLRKNLDRNVNTRAKNVWLSFSFTGCLGNIRSYLTFHAIQRRRRSNRPITKTCNFVSHIQVIYDHRPDFQTFPAISPEINSLSQPDRRSIRLVCRNIQSYSPRRNVFTLVRKGTRAYC